MRIGELAELTDKTVRALHLYEEKGLIEPVERSPGGFRLYDRANVARIHYIDRLQKLGLSLTAIGGLIQRWAGEPVARDAMQSVRAEYVDRLAALKQTLAELQQIQQDLEGAVAFLDGCTPCGREVGAPEACRDCRRGDQQAGLALVAGLTGR
ncbi:MAG: MerR family transcriptional regulator [Myxococcales bacterium]|nr:MerR family transcriptional regulator [Myxococcales bacterium]MCB9523010.1 MerR family transcriptional regulator [Myxococcales bacterium]